MPAPPVNWSHVGTPLTVTVTGSSSTVAAIRAEATHASGSAYAIEAHATSGSAIYGKSSGSNAYAIRGQSPGENSRGVYGLALGTDGIGVYGAVTHSKAAAGIFGYAQYGGSGVFGKCEDPSGGVGVAGSAPMSGGIGVMGLGYGTSGIGVLGETSEDDTTAIWGETTGRDATGVYGVSTGSGGMGVVAESTHGMGGFGIFALSAATLGIARGVTGLATARASHSVYEGYGGHFTAYGKKSIGAYGIAYGTRSSSSTEFAGVRGQVNSTRGYGLYASGNFAASGTKAFLNPHPTDPARSVQFICLEGNENGTYFRGKARVEGGRVEIMIPREWQDVTAEEGITVQVTALDRPARVWAPVTTRDRILVRADADCTVAYFVNGVRRGFENYEPYIPNTAFRPAVRGVPFGSQFPAAIRAMLVENGVLNDDFTPNEATAARLGWKLKEKDDVPVEMRWWTSVKERRANIDRRHATSRRLPRPDPVVRRVVEAAIRK